MPHDMTYFSPYRNMYKKFMIKILLSTTVVVISMQRSQDH